MFLSEDIRENLLIFSSNISYYYIFCVFISLVAVFAACFCQKSLCEEELKKQEERCLEVENTDDERNGTRRWEEPSADSAENSHSSRGNDSPESNSVDSPRSSADSALPSADSPQSSGDSPQLSADSPQLSVDSPQLSADSPQLSADSPQLSADSLQSSTNESSVGSTRSSPNSANSSGNSVISERELLIDSIASQMTLEEMMNEREIERHQLEEIFKLVNEQKEKYKIDSMEDLEDQMKLYR